MVAVFAMVWASIVFAGEFARAQSPIAIPATSQFTEVPGVVEPAPPKTANVGMTLVDLLDLESRVKALIPQVQPCVVSIEGGSGFVINETGLIITASHVIRNTGRQVTVRFSDGKSYTAVTLGRNRANDIGAVQLLDRGPWPHLEIAASSVAVQGQWCLTFGYPLSFARDAPAAVRLGQVTQVSERQIVTDCPIMGGDSGGPLVDLEGKVIGINTGVTTDVERNLHVPVAAFEADKTDILAGSDVAPARSEIRKAYFGVLGETDNQRVRIREVFKGSPAERAGLRVDDVITQLDGVPLDSFSKFLDYLESCRPGDRVNAEVNRYGKLLSFDVRLGQR
jgi:serine protease Do